MNIIYLFIILIPCFSYALPVNFYNYKKCPEWGEQYRQLTDFDNKVISVKIKGDYDSKIPENSLEAFKKSFEQCRPLMEINVFLTKDNEMIIFDDKYTGRMTNINYNTEKNTGTSYKLQDITLHQVKLLNLINVEKEITPLKIPTLEEFIDLYVNKNAGSIIFIHVNHNFNTLMKMIYILDELANKYNDTSLYKRFIIEMDFTYNPDFIINYLKKINYKNINLLNFYLSVRNEDIIYLSGLSKIKRERVIKKWMDVKMNIPVVDVDIFDISEFSYMNDSYLTKKIVNNITQEIIDSFKVKHKRISAKIPVPDYILWRKKMVAGYTVNNISGNKKPVEVSKAFYSDDGRCCFLINNKINSMSKDLSIDLEFIRHLGISIFKSIDTDSIDTFFKKNGRLDEIATPYSTFPRYEMKSALSWSLGYYLKPEYSSVVIEVESYSNKLIRGGGLCIYSRKKTVGVVYTCNSQEAYSWGFNDRIIVKRADGDSMYIYDPAINLCLTYSENEFSKITFWSKCTERSLWVRNGDNTIESYKLPKKYLVFKKSIGQHDNKLGSLEVSSSKMDEDNRWKLSYAFNRWVYSN